MVMPENTVPTRKSLTFPGLRANMQLANQPEHLENEISAPPSVQVDVNIHHYAPTPKDAEIDKMSASFLLPKVPELKDFRQFGASLRESRMAGLCFIRLRSMYSLHVFTCYRMPDSINALSQSGSNRDRTLFL